MTEALSQDEIDELLESISNGDDPVSDMGTGEESTKSKRRKRVRLYDFKRPSKFSKEQMRTVSMMHETFARMTTTSLSAQLRSIVGVHVAAVDELTYDEFIRSLSSPTTAAVVPMDPLKGSAILEIDMAITFAILDRLLGGPGRPLDRARELSDIEVSITEMIMMRILANLRESWSQVVDLRPRLSHIETNPQFVQIVAPGEMVLLITLETTIDKTEGIINFCFPYMTLEPIINKLSSQFWYSSLNCQTSPENLSQVEERLRNINLTMSAEIGRSTLSLSKLVGLKEGDMIRLDALAKKPVLLYIGGKAKYDCRVGILEDKYIGVQIIKKTDYVYEIDVDDLIIGGGNLDLV